MPKAKSSTKPRAKASASKASAPKASASKASASKPSASAPGPKGRTYQVSYARPPDSSATYSPPTPLALTAALSPPGASTPSLPVDTGNDEAPSLEALGTHYKIQLWDQTQSHPSNYCCNLITHWKHLLGPLRAYTEERYEMVIRGAIRSQKNGHLWTSVQQVELAFTCPHTNQSVLQRPTLSRLAAALNLADDEYWKAGHKHWQASHKHNLSTKRVSCATQEHILLEPGRENAGIRKRHQSGEIPCDHPEDTKCLFGYVGTRGTSRLRDQQSGFEGSWQRGHDKREIFSEQIEEASQSCPENHEGHSSDGDSECTQKSEGHGAADTDAPITDLRFANMFDPTDELSEDIEFNLSNKDVPWIILLGLC
ncbi:hypothetical protein SLS60_009814 [Paraconiothyrium brasiliense]|uniref:Uncharacterized protein n=1 Tax=Paraconiothyrium brasiliense TaxID=300254 RepID=A0ABR3QSJ9_9PLEO